MQKIRKRRRKKEPCSVFYSQNLFSENGAFGTIWVAAHFYRKLRRHHVLQTDISSSIDKIIFAEVPMALRILGYLLIGVVRIYAKKVEYLYQDCNEASVTLGESVTSGKSHLKMQSPCAPYMTISMPMSFELDAFNLEEWETEDVLSCGHLRHCEQLSFRESWADEGNQSSSTSKTCQRDDKARWPEILSTGFKLGGDVFLPDTVDTGLEMNKLRKLSDLETSIEKLRTHELPRLKCLDLGIICGSTDSLDFGYSFDLPSKVTQTNSLKLLFLDLGKFHVPLACELQNFDTLETSKEKSQGNQPPQEECLDSEMFCKVAYSLDRSPHLNQPGNYIDQLNFLAVIQPDVGESQLPQDRVAACTPDKSNFRPSSVSATPESMAILTPKIKEHTPMHRKKKQPFDETSILSNEGVKQGLHNTSDLVRKRKKCPHSEMDLWRAHKEYILHSNFMEPLNPYTPLELKALFAKEYFWDPVEFGANPKSDEVGFQKTNKSSIAKALFIGEAYIKKVEAEKFVEFPETSQEVMSETSVGSREDEVPSKSPDIGLDLMDEEISFQEDDQNQENLSTRTRAVAHYLLNVLFNQKDKQKGALKLTSILKGKSRTNCARLYYEVLVLKSKGYIDVKQDSAFGEIFLLVSPETKATTSELLRVSHKKLLKQVL